MRIGEAPVGGVGRLPAEWAEGGEVWTIASVRFMGVGFAPVGGEVHAFGDGGKAFEGRGREVEG